MHTPTSHSARLPWKTLGSLSLALIVTAALLDRSAIATEKKDWPVVCIIEDAVIAKPRRSARTDLEEAGETWLIRNNEITSWYAILSMPGCRAENSGIDVRSGDRTDIVVAPKGVALYSRPGDPGKPKIAMLRLRGEHIELPRTLSEQWRYEYRLVDGVLISRLASPPILSVDGETIVWTIGDAYGARAGFYDIAAAETKEVELAMPPLRNNLQFIQLAGASRADNEILIIQGANTILGFGFDGKLLWKPEEPQVRLDQDNLRLAPGGRLTSKSSGSLVNPGGVEWTTTQGTGVLTIDPDDRIGDIAIDPTGHLIAFSLYRYLENNDRVGELVVARTSDATIIHREPTLLVKALPPGMNVLYAYRAPDDTVAFLGSEYLAVTRLNDVRREVVVLQIPEQERAK